MLIEITPEHNLAIQYTWIYQTTASLQQLWCKHGFRWFYFV